MHSKLRYVDDISVGRVSPVVKSSKPKGFSEYFILAGFHL